MAHVSVRRHVDAPVERVWQVGTDMARWPEWLAGLLEVTELSGPGDQIGTTAVIALKGPDRIHHLRLEVTDVDRPRFHTHLAREVGGGMSYVSTTRLTPAGDGTDFIWAQDIEPAPGFVGALTGRFLLGRISEGQLRRSADNFEALLAKMKIAEPV